MKLSNIRVVLVETTHPGNIGAVARAMKNMGLEKLYLVAPRRFPHAEASARASGADDLLSAAVVCETLEASLSGCMLVFGASARLRTIAWPQLDPRQCAQLVSAMDGAAEVALVFGREHAGLTNEELEQCHYLVHIPTNPEFCSLNLAAAVQVMAYEARVACCSDAPSGRSNFPGGQLATADELAGFYCHLEQAIIDIGFLDPDNPRLLMRRLRRLFNRSRLEKMELNILRGILAAAQRKAGRSGSS